ncbi:MAG: Phosphoesterase family protein [Pedosphaera sp.]|nr:Phosphoesterase family protein [Pedosphaera sp.]
MSFKIRARRKAVISVLGFCLAAFSCAALSPGMGEDFHATTETVGRQETNLFATPVNQLLTPAGRQAELPGMRPQAVALSPDGKLLVTSGMTHELVVVDPVTGKILQRVALPTDNIKDAPAHPVSDTILNPDLKAQASFTGLAFSPDGSRIYLANVNGDIKVFGVQSGKVAPLFSIPLPPANAPRRASEIPAGIAVSADGRRLYVALNLSNRFAELDAATGRVLRLWDVGVEPYYVALAGRKAYVSNWGGRRPETNSVTGPAGEGTLVRVDPVRYVASEGSVSVIDLDSNTNQIEILTGLHASGLALSPNGRQLVVANAGSDTLSVIDTRTDQIIEQICARQNPGDQFGAQPNAVAFDKPGRELFVCNGTQNAVAVFKFEPGKSKLLGLIPVGWFPSAMVSDAKRKAICVANTKGLTTGRTNKNTGRMEYNSMQWHGSLSLVPVPSSRELAAFTGTALANMRYPLLAQAKLPPRAGQPARPVPERVGEPSLIKHVVYIIKENRTYDQVLGDVKEGNGDPSLCVFGERITPNQHKLVRDFALLDNTYDCGSRSSDGHQWADSAMATDYMEKSFGGAPRSYPAAGDLTSEDALAYSPAGFIWDDAIAHGKTLRDYGEYTSPHKRWKDPTRKGHPGFLDVYHEMLNGTDDIEIWSEPNIESVRPYIVTNTVGFDLSIPDIFRAAKFAEDVKRFEQTGNFPDLTIMWLCGDHTGGTSPGSPTPAAEVADNDLAVGRIVEAISHSKFWKETCVFIIEDDPQAGWDHVSGYRTTAYVAGPYVRHGRVVHTQYNQTSLLRTIELILGMPPMNQMDATATPMFDCFTEVPALAPFDSVPNNIPLDQVNPAIKKISDPLLRKDAYVSSRLPLDKADQCPEDVLNRILWRAMRGSQKPYPEWAVKTVEDD